MSHYELRLDKKNESLQGLHFKLSFVNQEEKHMPQCRAQNSNVPFPQSISGGKLITVTLYS